MTPVVINNSAHTACPNGSSNCDLKKMFSSLANSEVIGIRTKNYSALDTSCDNTVGDSANENRIVVDASTQLNDPTANGGHNTSCVPILVSGVTNPNWNFFTRKITITQPSTPVCVGSCLSSNLQFKGDVSGGNYNGAMRPTMYIVTVTVASYFNPGVTVTRSSLLME